VFFHTTTTERARVGHGDQPAYKRSGNVIMNQVYVHSPLKQLHVNCKVDYQYVNNMFELRVLLT